MRLAGGSTAAAAATVLAFGGLALSRSLSPPLFALLFVLALLGLRGGSGNAGRGPRIVYQAPGVEKLDQAFGGARGPLQFSPDLGHRGHPHAYHDGIEHEGAQFAAGHTATDYILPSLPQHG